jgi:hypothetical protein
MKTEDYKVTPIELPVWDTSGRLVKHLRICGSGIYGMLILNYQTRLLIPYPKNIAS